MKRFSLVLLAGASLALNSFAITNYAARVVQYDSGAGFSPGFTNTDAVIGEPSRVNPYGDAVDPIDPPYGKGQVLSIGAGGSVTVELQHPIYNLPRKPFGLDFIIFGNSGFIVTNDFDPDTYGWIGTPATDGSLFGANPGVTRVSVSKDGVHFFPLQSDVAPTVDLLFPTDGSGDFDVPVNPALTAGDIAGASVAQIRALYAGSGGGAGYNIAWARNQHNKPAHLHAIRFVRVEVLEGKAEVDGFSAVARHRKHAK